MTGLWALATLGLLSAAPARAQSVALTARSVYHGYQIQLDPRGPSDALRRLDRFYAAVEGGAYRLGSQGRFDLVASVRYDTDFGGWTNGLGVEDPLETFYAVPRDGRNDIDVLFLYLDWRNVIGREFDLRIGRQLQVDDLDWYVFDGLKLMGHLWREGENHFDVELYAGLPVYFDQLFASSGALLGDGIEIYDGEDPFGGIAAGANAFLRVFGDLSLSFSWRNEIVFREGDLAGFGPAVQVEGARLGAPVEGGAEARALAASASRATTGLQQSLVGGSLGYTFRPAHLTFQGLLVYDALTDNLDRARAALGFDPARNLHLGVEYLRIRPRFLGDSIFNWFNIFPYDRARVEGSWAILDERLTFQAQYFVQMFSGSPTLSGNVFEGEDVTHGPGGGVTWREDGYGLSAYAEAGTNFGGAAAYGGNYANAWLAGDVSFLDGRLAADARLSVTTVQEDWVAGVDDGRVDDPRTTFNVAIGVTGRPFEWLRARALYVQNIDPIIEGNYRVFTELAVLYR
jgi:hypothetical protein